jgi:hypothetical protein
MLEEQPLGQFYVLYCLRKDIEENTELQNLIIRRRLVSSTDANSSPTVALCIRNSPCARKPSQGENSRCQKQAISPICYGTK